VPPPTVPQRSRCRDGERARGRVGIVCQRRRWFRERRILLERSRPVKVCVPDVVMADVLMTVVPSTAASDIRDDCAVEPDIRIRKDNGAIRACARVVPEKVTSCAVPSFAVKVVVEARMVAGPV
jgi:hypothetical protein